MTIKEFTDKCRSLQGAFREKMGEPMGVGPWRNSATKYTNMLVNGEKTGKNFVNEFTFEYAKKRVENKRKNETIDEYRLFNNMLSSQPMAFNLFCPFIQMLQDGKRDEVTAVFQAIFPDKNIHKITDVGLEYLHIDVENYLNDRTAMDAIVRYIDIDKKPSFIAIETKYTDILGTNSGSKNAKYSEWIKRIGMFKPETEKALLDGTKPISQIYRNFLLTESYGIVEGANQCYSVVLAPAQHPTTEEEVASLKNELKEEFQYKIASISLEFLIEKALSLISSENINPFLYFRDRYIEALNVNVVPLSTFHKSNSR
ncbi:MAG: hypothetical protein J6X46_05485 [Prevotella sp.]|nr:hypothetical protein [Prevotella sp.]